MLFMSPASLSEQVPLGFYVADQKVSFTSRFFFFKLKMRRKKADDISEENEGKRYGVHFIVFLTPF